MQADKATLLDLSIFSPDEEFSIFEQCNLTRTNGGRDKLRRIFSEPLHSIDAIISVQNTLRLILQHESQWPLTISNGSILMIYKFFEESIETPPSQPNAAAARYYRVMHKADYSLIRYTVGHAFDFLKGMEHLYHTFYANEHPQNLTDVLQRVHKLLQFPGLHCMKHREKSADVTSIEILALSHYLRFHFKDQLFELIELYYRLDAWYGMAMAVKKYNLTFPELIESQEPVVEAKGLFHILLKDPVSYDIELNATHNFLFLTGANMAGKSTFIKSMGAAVYLAHTGMGVPAKQLRLCLFEGLLTNINVTDNIAKGESYFYNEVQRIKNTIVKIDDGQKWLVLIDELFKGTNVQDAMKCSTAVIKGLIKVKESLFILSTHLYEIADELEQFPNILFKYFETEVGETSLHFNYRLKDGISNDRLGYLILEQENVVNLLEELGK